MTPATMSARHLEDDNRRLTTQGARFRARLRAGTSAQMLRDRVMRRETQSLADTFDHLSSDDALTRAAGLIVSSRRRYVMGAGRSSAFAQLLGADLAAGLANVFQIDGVSLHIIDVLTDVRAQDVLVCFSVRRYRRETVELARHFARSGGHVVVVTDSESSPLASIGEVVITVDTGSESYADSPLPIAAVCHLLATLTIASAKGARRRLATRDALGDTLHQYVPDADVTGATDAH